MLSVNGGSTISLHNERDLDNFSVYIAVYIFRSFAAFSFFSGLHLPLLSLVAVYAFSSFPNTCILAFLKLSEL